MKSKHSRIYISPKFTKNNKVQTVMFLPAKARVPGARTLKSHSFPPGYGTTRDARPRAGQRETPGK